MAGELIQIIGLESAINTVELVAGEIENPDDHLEAGRPFFEGVIKRNFAEGGRPKKWPAKADGTASKLQKSGLLVGTINSKVHQNTILISAPMIYASVHNMGEVITFKTRPVSILMPQREFMIVPEEDEEKGAKVIAESIQIKIDAKKN